MKKLTILTLAAAFTLSPFAVRADETIGEKTKDAMSAIGKGLKNTAESVTEAVTSNSIAVKIYEKRMEMPTEAKAGDVTFVVTNAGTETRDFKVSGPGVERNFTEPLAPGQSQKLEVTLKPGAYKVEAPAKGELTKHLVVDLVVTEK